MLKNYSFIKIISETNFSVLSLYRRKDDGISIVIKKAFCQN